MNLIKTVQKIFTAGEFMDEFNGMHIDYSNNNDGNTGLFMSDDHKVSEDLIGNVTRQATFTIYRNVFNANDVERIQNSNFIMELGAYLENLSNQNITFDYKVGKSIEKKGVIKNINCSNGMMFQYLNGAPGRGAQYMLQIQIKYEVLEN